MHHEVKKLSVFPFQLFLRKLPRIDSFDHQAIHRSTRCFERQCGQVLAIQLEVFNFWRKSMACLQHQPNVKYQLCLLGLVVVKRLIQHLKASLELPTKMSNGDGAHKSAIVYRIRKALQSSSWLPPT